MSDQPATSVSESLAANPDRFRKNIATRIQLLLEVGNEEDYEIHATNIEKGVYNYAIKEANSRKIVKKWDRPEFVQIYMDKLRSLYINLKNPECHVIEQIQNGEIQPQNLANMTHQELNHERWRDLIEQKTKRDSAKYNTNIEASTDMFTCRKCKSKKCTYYEQQTRSADEPMTIFVSCIQCGLNWRQ